MIIERRRRQGSLSMGQLKSSISIDKLKKQLQKAVANGDQSATKNDEVSPKHAQKIIQQSLSTRLKNRLNGYVHNNLKFNAAVTTAVGVKAQILQPDNLSGLVEDTKQPIGGTLLSTDTSISLPKVSAERGSGKLATTVSDSKLLTPEAFTEQSISNNQPDVSQHSNQKFNQPNPYASGGPMQDLSGYKDLSKPPVIVDDNDSTGSVSSPSNLSAVSSAVMEKPKVFTEFVDNQPDIDTEFSNNVRTLIRLVNDLPDGVTKQTGAQIIRLTMEAMGISMEEVLTEAQSAQSEMLDAVRANIKKIEEYKTVIRKLESDIKYYQGKANELSEIIDLFILSNTSPKVPEMDELS